MRNQRGVALLVALVIAILLSLIGLSLTFRSIKDVATASEFENHEKAILVADGGFNAARESLRGRNVDEILAESSGVPSYVADSGTVDPRWASRNPISPVEARSIDFDSPPTSGGTRTVFGLLTPPGGIALGTGRYWAKLTDNADEAAGAADDPKVDRDGTVYLRVIGIERGIPGEVESYGGRRKNAVAIIEAQLHRDTSFRMSSPLSLVSDDVNANFSGGSFLVDGYDHSGMTRDELGKNHSDNGLTPYSGISCLYDDETGGDAGNAADSIREELPGGKKSKNNVIGKGTPPSPSVYDDTEEVRNSDDPDARNVLDPYFLQTVVARVAAIADETYTGTQHFAGNETLGTADDPHVTFVQGDLKITGNVTGTGLLVVTGDLDMGGSLEYDGLVLVVGKGSARLHGANKGAVLGGMLIANVENNQFGTATLDMRGNSNFYFSGSSISMALDLLSMRTLSWREITPEIEPGVSHSLR